MSPHNRSLSLATDPTRPEVEPSVETMLTQCGAAAQCSRTLPIDTDTLDFATAQAQRIAEALLCGEQPPDSVTLADQLLRHGVPLELFGDELRREILAGLAAPTASGVPTPATVLRGVMDCLCGVSTGYGASAQYYRTSLHDFDVRSSELRGNALFEALVRHLAVTIKADIVLVGAITDDGKSVAIIAVCDSSQLVTPFTYTLQGTPCAEALSGETCAFPVGVAHLFPDDRMLVDLNIEGYLGVALLGSDRRPVGVLAALYRDSPGSHGLWLELLERFGRRAATEFARVRHSQTLARGHAEMKAVLDQLSDPAAMHQDGRFVWVNNRMLALLGYDDVAELVGRPVLDIIHPDEHDVIRERIDGLLEREEAAAPHIARLIHRDGSVGFAEISGTAVTYFGRPAVMVVGRDMTTRRQVQQRMRHLDRLTLLGSVAAGLGHEINNPLTYMLINLRFAAGTAAHLQASLELTANQQTALAELATHIDETTAGCRRIGAAVRVVQQLANDDALPATTADVTAVIERAVQRTAQRFAIPVACELRSMPKVTADPASLELAICLILDNCADATVGNLAARTRIRAKLSVTEVQICIEDDGPGIAPEHLSKIFEPFFTTKTRSKDTGMSLALCRDMLERIGGRVEACNSAKGGARFTLTIPVDDSR